MYVLPAATGRPPSRGWRRHQIFAKPAARDVGRGTRTQPWGGEGGCWLPSPPLCVAVCPATARAACTATPRGGMCDHPSGYRGTKSAARTPTRSISAGCTPGNKALIHKRSTGFDICQQAPAPSSGGRTAPYSAHAVVNRTSPPGPASRSVTGYTGLWRTAAGVKWGSGWMLWAGLRWRAPNHNRGGQGWLPASFMKTNTRPARCAQHRTGSASHGSKAAVHRLRSTWRDCIHATSNIATISAAAYQAAHGPPCRGAHAAGIPTL